MCLEDVGVNGKIMLKWIAQHLGREGVHCLRTGTIDGLLRTF